MATKKTTKKSAKKMNIVPAVEAGAALAAVTAAAGAYYFYGTKHAKKHRQAATKWAQGLKKDVIKGAKSLKKIDAKTLARVVDDAAAAYQGVRGVAATDVRIAAKELKSNWSKIQAELAPSAKVTKTVKKVVSAVKKVSPKPAKKTAKRK